MEVQDVQVFIGTNISIPESFLPDPNDRLQLAQAICDGVVAGATDNGQLNFKVRRELWYLSNKIRGHCEWRAGTVWIGVGSKDEHKQLFSNLRAPSHVRLRALPP